MSQQPADIPLSGVLAEFRDALRDEVDAAARQSTSSAVPLINGRRIAQIGQSYQYLFDVENVLNLPGDAPGDLLIPNQRPTATTVISVTGLHITLSVGADLGQFVPTARLQSNLGYLLRKLIERIETLSGQPNPAGERLLGQQGVTGHPAPVDDTTLNPEQRTAVSSALGRDTTYIWGPPGTGKTHVIGAIGAKLATGGRSVLVVSHTNTAVDQALLQVADQVDPRLIEDGKVLRVGEPRDKRLLERPELLLPTHVARRSQALANAIEQTRGERDPLVARTITLGRLLPLAEWVEVADMDILRLRTDLTRVDQAERDAAAASVEHERLAEHRDTLERAWGRAVEALHARAPLARLAAAVADSCRRAAHDATVAAQRQAQADANYQADNRALVEAEQLLADIRQTGGLVRRWRGLPSPEEQEAVVADTRAATGNSTARLRTAVSDTAGTRSLLVRGEQVLARLQPYAGDTASALFDGEPATVIADAEATSPALLASMEAFTAAHPGLTPEAVDRDTRTALQRIAQARQQADADSRAAAEARAALADELRVRLAALRDWQLTSERGDTAEEALAGIELGRAHAEQMLAGQTTATLRAQLSGLNHRIAELDARITAIEEDLAKVEDVVISEALVVATTLTRAYLRDNVWQRRFDTVVLDEASMAPIPALWAAASRADRAAVAVGDWRQLPPVVLATTPAAQKWLGRDIFVAAGVDQPAPPAHRVDLLRQHRMHPDISGIVNTLIYGGRLIDDPATSTRAPGPGWYNPDWHTPDPPVLCVDTGPADAWVTSVSRGDSVSRLNFLSATVCADLAASMLLPEREPVPLGSPPRILLISPYRPHARLCELLLRDDGLVGEVTAGTTHNFQGTEADVVILDLVNDEPHWKVGMFIPALDDTTRRLINVAVTRARTRLVVVGDFDYITAQAGRAFLGRDFIPELLRRGPRVSALDVVPAGLSARVAAGQASATGGDVEAAADRVVVTHDRFFPLLRTDMAAAKASIVIYSPFLTAARLGQMEPALRAAVERDVAVRVVTKTLEDRSAGERQTYRALEDQMEAWGCVVIHKRGMHEKLIFCDADILWSGSLNPLSYSGTTQEVMERRKSREVVGDYAKTLLLDDLVAAYADGPPACPICGSEIVAAEGRDNPFYWRCVQEHCYSRGVDQPPLTDGLITCRTCAAPVMFGQWGGDDVWRCTANTRHRQRIAPTHLRLPKMRDLIPKRDLRRLDST